MTHLVPAAADLPPAERARLAGYTRQSIAPETLRGYRADWADFTAWCARQGLAPLPAAPATVAGYLAALAASHGRSALRRRLSAIGQSQLLAGHPWTPAHPLIRHTLRGILRQHGTPVRPSAALTVVELRRLIAGCDSTPVGRRDRALLLLGFAAALRRGELVAILREHVTFTANGLRLLIPRSKTDPEGEGAWLGIPRGAKPDTCPVRALEAWLQASACDFGPVFRRIDQWGHIDHPALHPDAVRQILRRRAAAAGLTVPATERLSPHGLRAGFITAAYQAGVRDEEIMAHSRHRDLKTMRSYVRRAKLDSESPAGKVGL